MKLIITSLFYILTCSSSLTAQVKNVVFEGAGIRGIAYAGAIEAMEQKGMLKDIEKVGGTSAGAITAMLLSIGYTSTEVASIIQKTPSKSFNQGRFLLFGGINRVRKYYGWYHGERMERWLGNLIEAKTNDADITFSQMKQKGYKDLYITATCLNKQSLIILSYETYPHMKVKDAVRISVSIPLYFEPVFINQSGSIVKHPRSTANLDVMVDGGFIANFPIRIFDSTRYTSSSLPNKYEVNPYTLGFRVDSDAQIVSDHKNGGLVPLSIKRFSHYMNAFYTLVIENLNRQALSLEDWQRTVAVSDGNISPRIRQLSKTEVQRLYNNGLTAATTYLLEKR
jgi:NTE family protein